MFYVININDFFSVYSIDDSNKIQKSQEHP